MLKLKENAKILIASDIHGSAYYIGKLMERVAEESPDLFVLLGDIYYHGPRNPLPKDYNPMTVCGSLKGYKGKMIVIKGNCDSEVDEMISGFRFLKKLEVILNDKLILFSHGHIYNMENAPSKKYDIVVYGHEHIGYIKQNDDKIFANCGSVSLPKENSEHSYLVIMGEYLMLKNVEIGHTISSYKIL